MASAFSLSGSEPRRDPREDVHFRARATAPDGRPVDLLVVNLSARGMMARCGDDGIREGQRLSVRLPEGGARMATVRWALGGRVGCEFDEMIDLAAYLRILAAVLRPAGR